ncbi:MAG: poly(3-hydroxybutyrate) depolymerase [Paracoccaceae bacterium]|jgi:poly(3-hydroxybutyrate) depolymerase
MLYQTYQLNDDLLRPMRMAARWALSSGMPGPWGWGQGATQRMSAALELVSRFHLSHARPDYDITSVTVNGKVVPVREEIAQAMPFGNLLRFVKDGDADQPKVLVVAPLSGHFSTLLRGTVQTLLRDHDVYITDWANARDVPLSAGRFGVEEYIDYLISFMETLGPGGNILAVCQPCVQALAAVAVMSEDKNPCTPRTMTLMAGPIDVRESPTAVNDLANDKPLSWFKTQVIATVPWRHKGRGRKVYPGFLQLVAFLAMNMDRHKEAHKKMFDHIAAGESEKAEKIKNFYDEYFAVLDMPEEFYVETIDRVFQKAELATGDFMYRGRKVDPGAIQRTALLTVEGGRDDICALGQTAAAHDLCKSLRPHLKRHHLQANVGHYGVFNGKRWEQEIYPVVRNLILSME